jgi:hypothetical protein
MVKLKLLSSVTFGAVAPIFELLMEAAEEMVNLSAIKLLLKYNLNRL